MSRSEAAFFFRYNLDLFTKKQVMMVIEILQVKDMKCENDFCVLSLYPYFLFCALRISYVVQTLLFFLVFSSKVLFQF